MNRNALLIRPWGPSAVRCDNAGASPTGKGPGQIHDVIHYRHAAKRLDPGRGRGPVRPALRRTRLHGRERPPGLVRAERDPVFPAALGEDRRLCRGLRLLQPVGAFRHRAESDQADGAGCGHRPGRPGQGRRRAAVLHGRRLARPEGPRPAQAGSHDRGRQGAGPGDLRDARHARAAPGRGPARRGPRLLQSQSGHRAGGLRPRHLHPHLSGPARHAGTRPGGGDERLLRRHRRHG